MTKKYALDLDDAHAGWVTAPDGYLDVMPWLRERRGSLLIEPAAAFWAWVDGSLEPGEAAIVAFDEEGREVERLVVEDAWITELGLPRVDPAGGAPGAIWLKIDAKAAELRAGGETTVSARGDGVAIAGCQLRLGGREATPLPVEAIEALSFALDRGSALQRLALTVTGAIEPGPAEALVGGGGALEYVDGEAATVVRVEFRVAGIDVQMAAVEAGGAPRSRVALACRGLQLGARGE